MAKASLKAGTTSKSVGLFIQDSASTTGAGLSGLVFNTSGLIAYWYQPGVTAPAAITLATLASATAAYSSGGFKEVDATNAKGHYRFDIPNAILTGATSAIITLSGAAGMVPAQLEIELTACDNQDSVRLGLSALPNAAASSSGGLPVLNSSLNVAADLQTIKTQTVTAAAGVTFPTSIASPTNITAGTITTCTTVTNQLTAAAIATGVWQDATAGDFTVSSSIGKSLYTSGAVPGAAGGHFIAGTNAATTVTTAFTSTFTGNLTGSVASVTGAVGSVTGSVASVTGNVGGNVVGSVASVTGAVGSVTGAVGSVTGLTTATIASAVLTTAMTESYNADGAAPTLTQAVLVSMQRLTEFAISSTAITVKKLDGSTTAYGLTLDSATTPTSSTRSS